MLEAKNEKKVLILGNKQYYNFKLDKIIDSFDIIYRFNLAYPGKNNGTKFGKLAMCSHVYENFVKNNLSEEEIIHKYKNDCEVDFLKEWYSFFLQNKKNFDEIFYERENNSGKWNEMLKDYGSPHRFTKVPSTGYSTIFRLLLNNDSDLYVSGFTLYEQEQRGTLGDSSGLANRRAKEGNCHSFSDERNILAWLHNNGKVDASLCMLVDSEELNLKKNVHNTQASEYIIKLLQEEK